MAYWWMSFADPDKPQGSQFLGALIIRGEDFTEAVQRSWSIGLNPGGEIQFFEIPKEYEYRIPVDWVETRLLTRKETEEFDRKWVS